MDVTSLTMYKCTTRGGHTINSVHKNSPLTSSFSTVFICCSNLTAIADRLFADGDLTLDLFEDIF